MELISLFQHFLVILSITLSLYFLFYVFKTKSTSEKFQLPPGSTGWPLIGETIEFLSLAKRNCIEKFISDRQNKYNPNLFKTSYIGENMVFLCSAEANKFFFSNDNKLFKTWFPRNFDKIFLHLHKLHNNPEETTKMRKQTSTLFSQQDALQNNVRIIDALAKEQLQEYWNCKEVKVHSLAKKFTLAISCRLMLNIQDSETLQELEKLFNCLMSGMFSLPINIPGTKFNRAIRASKEIRKKFEALIRQRKIEVLEKGHESGLSKDFLSMLLLDRYKDDEEVIESDVASTISGFIVAAYDNTSTAIFCIVKYLAELPKIYEEVLREQMEIANSKGPEELLNLGDINKMRYSWNVASEVLRLQPSFSGVFREAVTDFNYDEFVIPKGWKLHLAVHGTHKCAKYFPEPEKFDPSRFEGNKLVPFSYVPFGGGPHICPGREYARLQILVFMHNLVTKFRWEKIIPDEPLIRDPILAPAKGLPIRLYPHKA